MGTADRKSEDALNMHKDFCVEDIFANGRVSLDEEQNRTDTSNVSPVGI